MDAFSPAARTWFEENFREPTEVQRRGWEAISRGEHALLAAPTGSGKTLAAFLWGIDQASRLAPDSPEGVRILYVSPLKALVVDVERNLRAPLAGVMRTAERLEVSVRPLRVDVRTGDTPQRDRQRQARHPAEILVTTPESLYLILGSRARAGLATVTTVIIDEIHALAPQKRGAHLALSLERLSELCPGEPQRIGLSATARPLDEVGRFLVGARGCKIVDASSRPNIDVTVDAPTEDMAAVPPRMPKATEAEDAEPEPGGPILGHTRHGAPGTGTPAVEGGVWTGIHADLLEAIRAHRSTIVFVNSRGLCERLTQRLNELAGEELVLSHHGSVSHERREHIENALKAGEVRAIVATSSLELGIDMGAVDLVLLVESPGSVARGLQRIGRAGHGVGETSRGRIYPKFKGDLLESAVVASGMAEGAIEAVHVPENPLDVLAQQVVAMVCDRERSVDEIARIVRRAHPYRSLPDDALRAVLDMLSGRFPSTELAELRPRLAFDRAADVLRARRGTAMVTRFNAGTIPDRGAFPVHLGEGGPRLGELDEEMVYETREGDTFMLGSSTWRVEEVTGSRVIVSPAPGEPGRLPFWKGEGPGRPIELGRAMGATLREVSGFERDELKAEWMRRAPLTENAAENLAGYVADQRDATGCVPSDRMIVVERFRDELGDWRVCILTPFGARVHAPWGLAIQSRLRARLGAPVELVHSDDGIVLRIASRDGGVFPRDRAEEPEEDGAGVTLEDLFPEPEDVEDLVTGEVEDSAIFAALFRENAVRSLLITRRRPGERSPLFLQRLRARGLIAATRGYPDFPVVLETYRQVLADVFDLPALEALLRDVRSRVVEVREVETREPSPFAKSLVFAYVAAFLYEGDAPVAERRAQALTLDRGLLRELLGRAELRELLDRRALEEVEAELQATAEGRRARDADELHDLLRRLGDLSDEELAERSEGDAPAFVAQLLRERRALRVRLAGEERWIAAEDAGLFRDAVGTATPGGLPSSFLAPVPRALEELVRRYARTHGPFALADLAERFGLRPPQVEPAVDLLLSGADLISGEIRPGGTTLDHCDVDVLRRIKRRTLGMLRQEVAAAPPEALARLLVSWHGVGFGSAKSRESLGECLHRLRGLALSWSAWEGEVLPARVHGFRSESLDELCARGELVWIGRGARGPRDGNVAFYPRATCAELAEPPVAASELDLEPPALTILEHLERRGASFWTSIELALRDAHPGVPGDELEAALWSLVWSGLVTNDTLQPLRHHAGPPRTRSGRRGRGSGSSGPAGGRFWLVAELFERAVEPTQRLFARASALLDRYGIVSREAALHEGGVGGFSPLYRVLCGMEESGRVRRGYFVEGLSGSQFASPGALDRLREPEPRAGDRRSSEPEITALATLDPANPFGALVPWPETAGAERTSSGPRPRRVPGARVLLHEGRPVLFVPPNGRRVATFPEGHRGDKRVLHAAFAALTKLPVRGRRFTLEELDGLPVTESPLAELVLSAGFVREYGGFAIDPSARYGS